MPDGLYLQNAKSTRWRRRCLSLWIAAVIKQSSRRLRIALIGGILFGMCCIAWRLAGSSIVSAIVEYANADVALRDQLSSSYSLPVGIASLVLSGMGLLLQRRRSPLERPGKEVQNLNQDVGIGSASARMPVGYSLGLERLNSTPLPFGVQPVFVNMLVTNIFIKKRRSHRRLTERLVTAVQDNVVGYRVSATAFSDEDRSRVSFRSLWGCSIESIRDVPAADGLQGVMVRFPHPLMRGESHYFSSETVNHNPAVSEHYYINVEVDHLGISGGELAHGYLPVSGLTVRVRFEDWDVPVACWWYDDTKGRDGEPPGPGDPRRLTVVAAAVSHTFAQECQPLGNYGIAFLWASLTG